MSEGEEGDGTAGVTEEKRRLHRLRILVDVTCNLLAQGRMSRAEAESLVTDTRRRALELFPGKGDTFDLILAPRFERLMGEFVEPPPRRGKVLPFRTPPTRDD